MGGSVVAWQMDANLVLGQEEGSVQLKGEQSFGAMAVWREGLNGGSENKFWDPWQLRACLVSKH